MHLPRSLAPWGLPPSPHLRAACAPSLHPLGCQPLCGCRQADAPSSREASGCDLPTRAKRDTVWSVGWACPCWGFSLLWVGTELPAGPAPGKQAWQPWEGPGSHPEELGLGSHPGSEQREHRTASCGPGLPPPWPASTLPGCPGAPSVWGDTQPDTPQSRSACLPTCPLAMAAGPLPHSPPGSSTRHPLLTASV